MFIDNPIEDQNFYYFLKGREVTLPYAPFEAHLFKSYPLIHKF